MAAENESFHVVVCHVTSFHDLPRPSLPSSSSCEKLISWDETCFLVASLCHKHVHTNDDEQNNHKKMKVDCWLVHVVVSRVRSELDPLWRPPTL